MWQSSEIGIAWIHRFTKICQFSLHQAAPKNMIFIICYIQNNFKRRYDSKLHDTHTLKTSVGELWYLVLSALFEGIWQKDVQIPSTKALTYYLSSPNKVTKTQILTLYLFFNDWAYLGEDSVVKSAHNKNFKNLHTGSFKTSNNENWRKPNVWLVTIDLIVWSHPSLDLVTL